MREVISLSIGQAGIQIGCTCWNLYGLEHGIDNKGFIDKNCCHSNDLQLQEEMWNPVTHSKHSTVYIDSINNGQVPIIVDGFDPFYMEMSKGNFAPRNLMIDMEPTIIDTIKKGPQKDLFVSHTLISAQEDAANNFARGRYAHPTVLLDESLDSIRRLVENCDKLQGFMSHHSVGGGTGSGFESILAENLCEIYPKTSKLSTVIFPSPTMSTAIVEPYNAVLHTHRALCHSDCVFLADNEAMYNLCQEKLKIEGPTYKILNRLLAQTVSSITASLRFKGALNADFIDFQTNLVPYPRIHFPVVSYAPIFYSGSTLYKPLTVYDITSKCFECNNRLVRCENENGRYISCCLLYRGNVAPNDVNNAITLIKSKKDIKFVEWSPAGFKVAINERSPVNEDDDYFPKITKACCMLCNTTAVKELWTNLCRKFHIMFSKKTFLHWYLIEGMQEAEFYEAEDDILLLEQDYEYLSLE